MAQSIYIFDLQRHSLPLPRDLKDFGVLLEALSGKEDGRNPRFVQLGMRLEMRFSGVKPTLWLSNPLDEAMALHRAVWHFELPPADANTVFHAVVEMADPLGLVVYSDEGGVGFLPGDIIIPALASVAAAPRQVETGDPFRQASQVVSVLQPLFAQCLAPAGFKPIELDPVEAYWRSSFRFERTAGAVRQRISLRVLRYFTFDGSLSVSHDDVTAVYISAMGKDYGSPANAWFVNFCDFFHPGLDFSRQWNIEHTGYIPGLLALMRDKVIPLADLCSDLRGLDQVMNDPAMREIRTAYSRSPAQSGVAVASSFPSLCDMYVLHLSRLIVARLVGNPEFDRILAEFDSRIASGAKVLPAWEAQQFDRFRAAILAAQAQIPWKNTADFLAARRPVPRSLRPKPVDPRELRYHAWEVTRLLWMQAFDESQLFWNRFANGHGLAALHARWTEVGDKLPPEERVGLDGLACLVLPLPGHETSGKQIVLLEFPPSSRVEEWQALALVQGPHGFMRYSFQNPGSLVKMEAGVLVDRTVPCPGKSTVQAYTICRQAYDRRWLLAHIADTAIVQDERD